MIVSWNWLKQYVPLSMPHEELERRLMMAGLNHEGTAEVGGDLAIDLEVTSNRPDCLAHLGIAREVAVLFDQPLTIPPACPPEGPTRVERLVKVRIECPDLCFRYTARVIQGVRIGPSPRWMARRLETIGIAPVSNVVDVSNYVMMECAQPLHTFDYAKLKGPEIVVRRPRPGERIEAIDHKVYDLGPEMCVIADAEDAVAIGGVMGGATTEISAATTDILVEAAEFDPVSIRNTARQLNLHSDSSYRFERRIDPEGLDWASRRCCELILEVGGGQLAAGVVDVGQPRAKRQPIVLRFSQLKRILGIDIAPQRVRQILVALGNVEVAPPIAQERASDSVSTSEIGASRSPMKAAAASAAPVQDQAASGTVTVVAPSWRRDLSREIDLVEEVARIHGYDQIPEDVGVPMVSSARRFDDRVVAQVRHVLTALGFDEAVTLSVVDQQVSRAFSPWTEAEPLRSLMPVIRGADRLRCSLVPSLLAARRTNEALANNEIELFEIARVYLPREGQLPDEQMMLGITSSRDYVQVKGVVETILCALNHDARAEPTAAGIELLESQASCNLQLGGETLGYVGRLTESALKQFDLRRPTTVAEVKLSLLVRAANLVPRYVPLPPYPAVTRDLNLVVSEAVRWADLAATVRAHGSEFLEGLDYRDTYRDPQRLGDKKSLLLTISLRSREGTLTSQQADQIRDAIVAACRSAHGAELRA